MENYIKLTIKIICKNQKTTRDEWSEMNIDIFRRYLYTLLLPSWEGNNNSALKNIWKQDQLNVW